MSIIAMLLFMLFPVFIPVIGELTGRLNDTYGFFGRQRSERSRVTHR